MSAYTVVEPVSRCADEDRPVVGVITIAVLIEKITSLFFVVGLSASQGLKEA